MPFYRNPIAFEKNDKPSVTIPEQSLSVREIIERQIVDPLNQDNLPSMTDETDALQGDYPSDYAEIPTDYELELIADDYGQQKSNEQETSKRSSQTVTHDADSKKGSGIDSTDSGAAASS